MAKPIAQPAAEPITRDHIESKLRDLKGQADTSVESAKQTALIVGGVLAFILLMIAFWFGRRGGRKAKTVIEVRRF